MEDLPFVYLLKCANGKYSTGYTKGLGDRLHRHNREPVIAIKKNRPVEMITCIALNDKYRAFECEKHPKTGSGRAVMDKQMGKIRA